MKRSKHSLSHYKLLTCDMGKLIPISCFEVLPGDSIQMATSLLMRTQPLLAPVMHPVTVRVHSWFVPHRIVWDDWEEFIVNTGTPTYPTITDTPSIGSLDDYLGVPTGNAQTFSALPRRSYNKIFNEFYRDQDIVSAVVEDAGTVQNISWEKDYFTTARPWPQYGDDITLPSGTKAPVTGIGADTNVYGAGAGVYEADGSTPTYASAKQVNPAAGDTTFYVEENPDLTGFPNIFADLAQAEGFTANAIRTMMALQRFQEARARWGTRYAEYLAYLGVRSSDARLQRPEYLGGGKQTISFSEVLQTGPDASDDGVASLKGHGIAAVRSRRFRRFFEEHGLVLTLLSVRPRSMYVDGRPRMWDRRSHTDYWQRELEAVGQQEVYRRELYAGSNETTVFGYQDRYAEYRRVENQVSGDFRNTLAYWHMARNFSAAPELNPTFINCNPTTDIYAVTTADPLLIMASHSVQARRMVRKNVTPHIY